MLHENAKERLRRAVPTEYDLTWYDETIDVTVEHTIELGDRQVRWDRNDSPPAYPAVILRFDPEGQPRGEMGHMFRDGIYREPHPDRTVAYREWRAKPMFGLLNVTVAVRSDVTTTEGDLIPRRIVADQMAMWIFDTLEFDSEHLEHQGTKPDGSPLEYAWPMQVQGIGPPGGVDTSTTVDEQSVQRRAMEYGVEYVYYNDRLVDAVQALEYKLRVDGNNDGEFHTAYEDERIELLPPEEDDD